MVHAAEGTLQAYLDDEIDSAAEAVLREHVAVCGECAGQLEALRRANSITADALALLDTPVPMLEARAALARERQRGGGRRIWARMGAWSLAKAAMLMLVLAGAGAAAIPDVRRALETTFSRVAALFTGPDGEAAAGVETVEAEPVAAEAESVAGAERSESFVTPVNGRVQITLHAPSGVVEVVVRLVESAQAEVETVTSDGPVRLRVGTGRLEVTGLGAGTVTIGIPRAVTSAIVEVDGEVRVYKRGDRLLGSGSEADARGSEVRFITGS